MFKIFFLFIISINALAWEKTTLSDAGFDETRFKEFSNWIFTKTPDINTETILILKDKKIVFEKYTNGDKTKLSLLWSMSKTVSGFILGAAYTQGYFKLGDTLDKYIDSNHPNLKKITLNNLFHMSSGLAFNEFYEKDPFNSHVARMLYLESDNMAQYVYKLPLKHIPGDFFYYSSGDANVLMKAFQGMLPKKEHDEFPWKNFFIPMGIKKAIFEQDKSGMFVGASYVYLTTEDQAKLGQLILDNGLFKDKQIISKKWIDYMVAMAPAFNKTCKDNKKHYGALVWLNTPCPGSKINPMPDAPSNLIMFLGHNGQSVFIYPDLKIVMVRVAQDHDTALDKNKYAKMFLRSLK